MTIHAKIEKFLETREMGVIAAVSWEPKYPHIPILVGDRVVQFGDEWIITGLEPTRIFGLLGLRLGENGKGTWPKSGEVWIEPAPGFESKVRHTWDRHSIFGNLNMPADLPVEQEVLRLRACLSHVIRRLSRGQVPDPNVIEDTLSGKPIPQCGHIGCRIDFEHVH